MKDYYIKIPMTSNRPYALWPYRPYALWLLVLTSRDEMQFQVLDRFPDRVLAFVQITAKFERILQDGQVSVDRRLHLTDVAVRLKIDQFIFSIQVVPEKTRKLKPKRGNNNDNNNKNKSTSATLKGAPTTTTRIF